ncbi:hypothetical protein LBMAG56_10830 [Verrucomicrobiota bacterium]|nr:hypothetical protein LBMAG56_10830 [Verrucomicrobiota bacterium]
MPAGAGSAARTTASGPDNIAAQSSASAADLRQRGAPACPVRKFNGCLSEPRRAALI